MDISTRVIQRIPLTLRMLLGTREMMFEIAPRRGSLPDGLVLCLAAHGENPNAIMVAREDGHVLYPATDCDLLEVIREFQGALHFTKANIGFVQDGRIILTPR